MKLEDARSYLEQIEGKVYIPKTSFGQSIVILEKYGYTKYDFSAQHAILYGPGFEDVVEKITEEDFKLIADTGWFEDSGYLSIFV